MAFPAFRGLAGSLRDLPTPLWLPSALRKNPSSAAAFSPSALCPSTSGVPISGATLSTIPLSHGPHPGVSLPPPPTVVHAPSLLSISASYPLISPVPRPSHFPEPPASIPLPLVHPPFSSQGGSFCICPCLSPAPNLPMCSRALRTQPQCLTVATKAPSASPA